MSLKAVSTPNIALIKYWGNRDDSLRVPAADSISMTLNEPSVQVEIEPADMLSVQSFGPDGNEKILSPRETARIHTHIELMNTYLKTIGTEKAPPAVFLRIRSNIPPSVGLASSSAVFSAIGRAYSRLFVKEFTEHEVSILSRLGSGSASRSTFGGFAAMVATGSEIGDGYAEQIADEHHWNLHDIVIIPPTHEKDVGSTDGHALASTSPHWRKRMQEIPNRAKECIDAILQKDFEKLQRVAEVDCLDMHKVMETSKPPLKYLNAETHRIIKEVDALRTEQHMEVLYTMDAGPTVHLICTDNAKEAVHEYANAQKNCQIFETKIGPGSHIL